MKTRKPKADGHKGLDKSQTRSQTIKPKVSKNVISSEKVCNRCRNHEIVAQFKGHKCPYIGCDCLMCKDYAEKTRRKNESAKRRRREKNERIDNNVTKNRSKSDANSLVNALKAKSKKILNKKSLNKKSFTIHKTNAQTLANNALNDDEETEQESDDNPPVLRPETTNASVVQNANTNEIMNGNQMGGDGHSMSKIRAEASLCAQYLKASKDLTRKLSQIDWTLDEMMACFKFSLIKDCLGDTEMAVQKIVFARQEMLSGSAYMIQHPCAEPTDERSAATTAVNRSKTPQKSESNASNPPILCSTYNRNYRPNTAVNYSPAFTPIRRT